VAAIRPPASRAKSSSRVQARTATQRRHQIVPATSAPTRIHEIHRAATVGATTAVPSPAASQLHGPPISPGASDSPKYWPRNVPTSPADDGSRIVEAVDIAR
jgi:hypothetical protein